MDHLTLYQAPFSTCSQKVRLTLALKMLQYESRLIDLSKSEHLRDDYIAINPNGVVPTLGHGAAYIHDSSVICEYLDEVFPAVSLSPQNPVERAHMRAWMRYFEEVPTAAIRAPSFNKLFMKAIGSRSEQENQRIRERMPLRRQFYEKMGPAGFDQDIITESEARLASCLSRVEATLVNAGPYLMGDQLTLADILLLPTIVRMDDLGMFKFWGDRPGVAGWYARLQANPAFQITYEMPGSRLTAPMSASN